MQIKIPINDKTNTYILVDPQQSTKCMLVSNGENITEFSPEDLTKDGINSALLKNIPIMAKSAEVAEQRVGKLRTALSEFTSLTPFRLLPIPFEDQAK